MKTDFVEGVRSVAFVFPERCHGTTDAKDMGAQPGPTQRSGLSRPDFQISAGRTCDTALWSVFSWLDWR